MVSYARYRARNSAAAATGRGNKRRDTEPELMLRRALWKRGVRYRLHASDIPGTPDLVFRVNRLAVFCDGDFWHGKDWPSRRAKLKRGHNAPYWIAKIKRNRERDAEVDSSLRSRGWSVLRFWESDILTDPDAVADAVVRTLGGLQSK